MNICHQNTPCFLVISTSKAQQQMILQAKHQKLTFEYMYLPFFLAQV
jgi:hypothetical protein